MTEIRKLVNTSPIGIHLLSAGGSAAFIVYHIYAILLIALKFLSYIFAVYKIAYMFAQKKYRGDQTTVLFLS